MKFDRVRAEGLSATLVVLAILLSGSVYAFSTSGSLSGNSQNAPLVLEDGHSSTSTSRSDDEEHGTMSTTSTHTSHSEDDHRSSTTTSTTTHSESETGEQGGNNEGTELPFRLVAVGGGGGQGNANIMVDGTDLDGHIQVEKLASSTTYAVYLVAIPAAATSTSTSFSRTSSATTSTSSTTSAASCTGTSLGSFVTRGEGDGEAELSGTLNPGTYEIGLVLCTGNSPALVTDPITRTATVSASSEREGESSSTHTKTETSTKSGTQSTTTRSSETENDVKAVTTGKHDEGKIKTAEAAKTIPAVVSYGASGVSLHQIDPHFSVSASPLRNNGLLVSISGLNVTGSRVLEVNLTGSHWTASTLQGLQVTLDGTPIAQAASLSQVLSSTSADPARYIILITSEGLQMLVSIPHFSLHTIQILPSVLTALSYLVANGPILLTGLIIFSGFAAALFSKRKRFFALVL